MTAEPVDRGGPAPPPTTPSEIRRSLLAEETGQFDREWRSAMARSVENLDLTEVYGVLDRWSSIAAMARDDPEAHRRMLRRVDRIGSGEERGTVTAADQRSLIALRLGRQ